MMSLSDFKEKQILFVEAKYGVECNLKFENENILYCKDKQNINRLSCSKVFAIFIIGNFTITSVLVKKCKKYGISLFLLGNNFQPYAEVLSGLDSNYLLRDKQYKFDDELSIAKILVYNKITNQLKLLKGGRKSFDFAQKMAKTEKKILTAKSLQELLGIEGNHSKEFFGQYFEKLQWIRRMPRTKYDINNVLLDIGYTFLFNFIDALLRLYGFDTYKGFYHKLFFQRKSLVCDVMEPFRCLIDQELLKAYNLNRINKKDFRYENGKYVLSFANQQKYICIFFEAIMGNKEKMFSYVHDLYRFFVVPRREFPVFKIK